MKLPICILMLLASIDSLAQYSSTTVSQRVGRGADSLECMNNIALFAEYMKEGKYQQAYTPWKVIISKAPLAQISTYTQGEKMFRQLIEQESDSSSRSMLISEMMQMYDTRLANIDTLLALFPKSSKACNVECRKGYFLSEYLPSDTSAYAILRRGIQSVNSSESDNADAFLINRFFELANLRHARSGKTEQLLSDYISCRICCDRALERTKLIADTVAARQYVADYRRVKRSVNTAYKALDPETRNKFISNFSYNIERNSKNIDYLSSALRILSEFGFENSGVYFKASQYAHSLKPSYESSIGMALYKTSLGKPAEAVAHFTEAMQQCDNNKLKSQICYRIARLYLKSNKSALALSYLDKSCAFDKTMSGRCNLARAQAKALVKEYKEAISLCEKAKSEDLSVAEGAERLIRRCEEAIAASVSSKSDESETNKKKEQDFWNEDKKQN